LEGRGGGGEEGKFSDDFELQYESPVGILTSVPSTFGLWIVVTGGKRVVG